MQRIKFSELSGAFDFVNHAAPSENVVFLDRETGRMYWVSAIDPIDEEEELPEDLETSDRYLVIPHMNDLDLGSRLALQFAAERLPHRFDAIVAVFRRRGAYARFKEILASERCLDAWYEYEAAARDRALRNWCKEHEIEIDEDGGREAT